MQRFAGVAASMSTPAKTVDFSDIDQSVVAMRRLVRRIYRQSRAKGKTPVEARAVVDQFLVAISDRTFLTVAYLIKTLSGGK